MTPTDIAAQLRSLSRAQIEILRTQYDRSEQKAIAEYCKFREAGNTTAAEQAYTAFKEAHEYLLTIAAQEKDLNERGLL